MMKSLQTQFASIQQRLDQLSPGDAASRKGATDEEIANLEEYAGGSLPLAYRIFLETMGQSAGCLFRGSHALLSQKWSLRFREFARKMLSNNGTEDSLPDSAFVFLMNQGYQFLYIRLDEGDNPPVYIITDSDPEPKLLSETFTGFIDDVVTGLEELAATKPMR